MFNFESCNESEEGYADNADDPNEGDYDNDFVFTEDDCDDTDPQVGAANSGYDCDDLLVAKDKALLLDDVSESSISSALIKLIEDNNFRVFLQKKAWKNYSLSSKSSSQKLNLVRRNLILG